MTLGVESEKIAKPYSLFAWNVNDATLPLSVRFSPSVVETGPRIVCQAGVGCVLS